MERGSSKRPPAIWDDSRKGHIIIYGSEKGKSRIRGIIILVLLAVMLVSGAMSIRSWMEDKRTREEYERLAELARETTAQPSTEAETEPGTAEPETEPYVSPINFEELMRRIRIPSDGYGCRIPTLIIPLFRERTTIST